MMNKRLLSLLVPAMYGVTPAAPAAARPTVAWGRKREPMKVFSNVAAGAVGQPQTAFSKVPRYPRTILGFILQKGGTAFVNADIPRIELFLGEKSIFGPISAADVAMINRVESGDVDNDANFLCVDFTFPHVKEIGGEQIGGIDLVNLPAGELRLEVDIASTANAPTLRGDVIWSPPQGTGDLGNLMTKLIRRAYPQMPAGDNFPDVNLRGAIVARQFLKYTVPTAAVSAASGINNGVNTGNGVMGAIAVAANTPTGRYRLQIVAAAANAGTFMVTDPYNKIVGFGTVGVAFTQGGLTFTLADGAVDFLAGDGFTIDVLPASGNLNSVEVKKNEDVWWSRSDIAARFEQRRYGRTPLSQLYIIDWLLDNHSDSMIDTANALALDYKLNFTAPDTLTVVHQVLAQPTQF